MKDNRVDIPMEVKRRLLVECGFACSVPRCAVQWPILQFHHIDENPANSTKENLLVLCPTHHQMATSKHMDRKHCEMLKQLLVDFSQYDLPAESKTRNRLLYSLAAELFINSQVLAHEMFLPVGDATPQPMVYLRLYHSVLDEALSSGLFINDQDNHLFRLIYDWAQRLREFNRRLDVTESRILSHFASSDEIKLFQQTLATGEVLNQTKQTCNELMQHITDEYGEEAGISQNTQFFKPFTHELIQSAP